MFRILVAAIALLPFKLLYILSDGIAWMLQYIFNYRAKVISKNLDLAFPEISSSEKNKITSNSYKNLSDNMLETLKGFSSSAEQIKKRYIFEKASFLDELYQKKRNIIVFTSHVANWEWASYAMPLSYEYDILGLFKPISNPYINKYIDSKRKSTGLHTVNIYKQTRSQIFKHPTPFILVYIADQNPPDETHSLKIKFFNQDTFALHGFEKLARKKNWPVVHYKTKRLKRGYYKTTPYLVELNPKDTNSGEITQKCFKELEDHIRENPGDWLWSHKRWKRNVEY